jgi:LPPG:FO 2-phospho-L-lactate transferase
VTYTLAGLVNPKTGWGLVNDTFYGLDSLLRFYDSERWFNLGDRDLATHIYRTDQLRQGKSLTEITRHVCEAMGVEARVLPVTDAFVPTTIVTERGPMHFQEYLLRHRAEPVVKEIRFENIADAAPTLETVGALTRAEAIVFCPSNPLISIGPILTVPGVRKLIEQASVPKLAISPIIKGQALKGPADRMLQQTGSPATALGVAQIYANLIDGFIIDQQDADLKKEIEKLGLKVFVTNTVMSGAPEKYALALFTMQCVKELQST